MKKILPFAMAATAMIAPVMGQATSNPVGYVSLGDTASGQPALAANSEITFSIPLIGTVEASATASGAFSAPAADGSVTLDVNEALTAAQFDAPATGAPFLVHITSGDAEGLYAVIQSHTDTTITLLPQPGDETAVIAAGDTLSIRQASTLETLFPSAGLPDGTAVIAYELDTPGTNKSGDITYVVFDPTFSGAKGTWTDQGSFTAAADAVLYPGESFIMQNPTSTPINSLVVSGEVPLTRSRVRIAQDASGARDTRFSVVNPVDQLVSEFNFTPAEGDVIFVYDNSAAGFLNKSASNFYTYGVNLLGAPGLGWNNGATLAREDFVLTGSQGYIYQTATSASNDDIVTNNIPGYVAGLNN